MKTSTLILILPLVLGIAGCNDKDLFNEKKPDQIPYQAKSLLFDAINIQVDPLPTPNKYQLLIRWPKDSKAVKVVENGNTIFQGSEKMNYFSYDVAGGSALNLDIQQKTFDNDYESIFQKKITVPLDYVFTNKTNLTADFSFEGGRVFLLNSAFIQTNSFNLSLQVDEFISENATIETFPISKKTFETPGESGGNILISTRQARGKLTANMRGINGGDGRDSWCWPQFNMYCNAASGASGGNAGFFTITVQENLKFELVKNIQNGLGGRAGIACVYNNQSPAGPHFIYDWQNNCQGYGREGKNGNPGPNGVGKICSTLSNEADNECI